MRDGTCMFRSTWSEGRSRRSRSMLVRVLHTGLFLAGGEGSCLALSTLSNPSCLGFPSTLRSRGCQNQTQTFVVLVLVLGRVLLGGVLGLGLRWKSI